MPRAAKNQNEGPAVRTQFLIFTLFGEYLLPRGGSIWTSDLLTLMELLGVTEQAARSTLSRMTRKGWINPRKEGRRSQYSLTARGRDLLQRGGRRIFEPIITDWDGQWHIVVYSLPEKKRHKRHTLRAQLRWLGFGPLAPGTWISPHNPAAELESIFEELEVGSYVQQFEGAFVGPGINEQLVYRCWDLEGLEVQYRQFIDRFLPQYLACREQFRDAQPLDPADCFVSLFWLTHEFQAFPRKDPNLPLPLLPPDWIGVTARKLFEEYRGLLASRANQFVDDVIAGRVSLRAGAAYAEGD